MCGKMAQGLDLKNWDEPKSPCAESKTKLSAILKRTRSSTGSRRIFPPQFKIQVLDSYRNDLDCRGNQRATARKYNIHRRQIQKWLQCEQNLRSSVEEGDASKKDNFKWSETPGTGKTSKKTDSVKNGGGKADTTLNRSAMIYARLSDAEKDESAVRETLNPETEVYDRRRLFADALNLKRVAQKLYPSEKEANIVACTSPRLDDNSRCRDYDILGRDDNFNRVSPEGTRAADGEHTATSTSCPPEGKHNNRAEPMEILPNECCKTNDKAVEIFTLQAGNASAESAINKRSRGLSMSEICQHPLCENVEGQKLCDENAVHKCAVQKYTDCGDGQKFCAGSELLCSRDAESESHCLLDTQSVVSVPSAPCYSASDVGSAGKPHLPEDADKSSCDSVAKVSSTDDSKSYRPKRKWMQESLMENAEDKSYPTLPIKQRVKMNLKTAAATSASKGVSRNFTIEKLCGSDLKTETVTPPGFHFPPESEYYNWRPADACIYPLISPSSLSAAPLPFPPPLLFSHRMIPDLVSLHFKPESPEQKPTPSCNVESSQRTWTRSCSPDSLDISLKEEKLSEGEENADIDVLSTSPVEKKSFEFGGYNFGKRRSFSVQFKLTVLDAFYNDKDCNKNQRATARKFNINRRQVQKWLSQENDLRSEGSMKNGKYLQRQRLGNEREMDADDACKQCPRHCSPKKKEAENVDKTIEVNVKHCTDRECLSRNKSSSDSSATPFREGFEFYKGYYQSDLKSANVYDNYLFPENSNMISHDSFFSWPNLNSSALPVPNFHFMASWYHNFDFCHEKSKIY